MSRACEARILLGRGWGWEGGGAGNPQLAAPVCPALLGIYTILVSTACWMPLLMRWITPSPGWMGSSGRWPKYPT